jgi:hypothetical protein
MHYLAAVIASTVGVAVAAAPTASAAPECTSTTPTTTQCERNGHVQINSSPNVVVNTGPFLQEPWLNTGIPVIGIGGWAVPPGVAANAR